MIHRCRGTLHQGELHRRALRRPCPRPYERQSRPRTGWPSRLGLTVAFTAEGIVSYGANIMDDFLGRATPVRHGRA
jgi:hypothetical protein